MFGMDTLIFLSWLRAAALALRALLASRSPLGGPTFVGIACHRFTQFRRRRRGNTPSIHRLRTARPNFRFVLRILGNVVDVAGVFSDVSKGISEIAKDVVAGAVAPRAPCRINAVLLQVR